MTVYELNALYNKFILILPVVILLTSVSIVCYVYYQVRVKKRKVRRDNKGIQHALLSTILRMFMPKKGSTTEVEKEKMLAKAGLDLELEAFYFIRVAGGVLIALITLAILLTNTKYRIGEVFKRIEGNDPQAIMEQLGQADANPTSVGEDGFTGEIKKYYYIIHEEFNISLNTINTVDEDQIIQTLSTFLDEEYKMDAKQAELMAREIYDKTVKILLIEKPLQFYIAVSLLAFVFTYYISEIVVHFIAKMRYKRLKEELDFLFISTYILGSLNLTVYDILNNLRDISKEYAKVFGNAADSYVGTGTDRGKTIMDMSEEVKLPSFRNLCLMLVTCQSRSRTDALHSLSSEIDYYEKDKQLRSEDLVDTKMNFTLFALLPAFFCFLLLLIIPFLKIIKTTDISMYL